MTELNVPIELTLSTAQVEQHQMTEPSLTIQLVVKVYFNILSQHLPRETEKIHGKHYTKLLNMHVYQN